LTTLMAKPNSGGEAFGSERLRRFMASHASCSPAAFCDQLMFELMAWRGRGDNPHDDITMVVVDFKNTGDHRPRSQ
jgi:serine phosphatase RsbU (regulator of sigma subunit)